jgi:hypothetical protein
MYVRRFRFAFDSATGSEIHGCMESWFEVTVVLIHTHIHAVEAIPKATNILFVVKPGIYQSKIFHSITSRLSLIQDTLFHHAHLSPSNPILMSITYRGNDSSYRVGQE